MQQTVKIGLTDGQKAAIELAAQKMGLSLSAYIRMSAINHAAALGFQAEQPQVDG